ncbi:MAG: hypothetical protein IPM63_16535 [Acidobacteriota bacterium]|nr:MAG: hypothetical protein IPM63_16535 [Acidobacteriota bacterium]
MRLTLLILSILFLSSYSTAQECTVTEPPALLNLRLGMTLVEVNSVTRPDLKVKAETEGEETFFKNWIKKPAKGKLAGVRAIYLSFFRGRLYQIEVFYQDEFRWEDLESLLTGFSADTGFAREFWKVKNGYAKARCEGFTLEADRVLGAHVQITDDAMMEAVEAFRKKN